VEIPLREGNDLSQVLIKLADCTTIGKLFLCAGCIDISESPLQAQVQATDL